MAVEWKDTSSWSQSDVDRTPKEWTARIGMFRLVVHRHVNYPPDRWLASCSPAVFPPSLLAPRDIDEAKCQAVARLQCVCEGALRDITGDKSDDTRRTTGTAQRVP